MANPSPAAVAAIRAKVADWTPPVESIAAALNAPDAAFPNPTPQGQTPRVVEESALLSLLADPANGSIGKLLLWVNFGLLKADIEASNRPGIGLWCSVLPALGLITAGEAGAIASYLQSTIADPSWQADLSWAQATIGRPVDTYDLIAAKAAGA